MSMPGCLGCLMGGLLGVVLGVAVFGAGFRGGNLNDTADLLSGVIGGVMGVVIGFVLGSACGQIMNSTTRRESNKPVIQFRPQIAGAKCAACGRNILMAGDGWLCPVCNLPVHHECTERHECSPPAE